MIAGLMLFATHLKAQEPSDQDRDIYSRIDRLADSLRVWAAVGADSESEVLYRDESVPDSLELTEHFPGAVVAWDDSTSAFVISLPRFMDMLETGLWLEMDTGDGGDAPGWRWRAPVSRREGGLFIDEQPILFDSTLTGDLTLIDEIRHRLTILRTMGVPPALRPADLVEENTPVTLLVRGRSNQEIEFTLESWLKSLGRISEGNQVYAGLLDTRLVDGIVELEYYALITYPGVEGHHFLEWTDRLEKRNAGWRTIGVKVVLVPYIRTDNLNNLFAKPSGSGSRTFELRLSR